MVRKIEIDSECEYEDCSNVATDIVYSRKESKVMLCCEGHADMVQDEGNPEYWHTCENCECRLPIN